MDALDANFSLQENVLRLRTQRQEILAANIANADTPNYKAKDFDFKEALNEAMAANAASAMETTSPLHMKPIGTVSAFEAKLKYRPIVQGNVDGNTVDMDVERNQFTDNALRYESSIMMLNSKIKQMMSAIQGQ